MRRAGGKEASIDLRVPKHLEQHALECQRLGGRVHELHSRGEHEAALTTAQQRLEIAKKIYGEMHAVTALCLNDVGSLERVFGRFSDAEARLEAASKIQRKVLGECHPHSIATLQNLASLYSAMGEASKAEAMGILVQALQATSSK